MNSQWLHLNVERDYCCWCCGMSLERVPCNPTKLWGRAGREPASMRQRRSIEPSTRIEGACKDDGLRSRVYSHRIWWGWDLFSTPLCLTIILTDDMVDHDQQTQLRAHSVGIFCCCVEYDEMEGIIRTRRTGRAQMGINEVGTHTGTHI